MDFAGQLFAAEFRYSSYSYCTVLLLYKTTLSRTSLGTHAGCQHHNSHEICTRSAHEICTISSAERSVITPCPWSMDQLHACYTHHSPTSRSPLPKTRGDAILLASISHNGWRPHVSSHPRMYVGVIASVCAFSNLMSRMYTSHLCPMWRSTDVRRLCAVSASPRLQYPSSEIRRRHERLSVTAYMYI